MLCVPCLLVSCKRSVGRRRAACTVLCPWSGNLQGNTVLCDCSGCSLTAVQVWDGVPRGDCYGVIGATGSPATLDNCSCRVSWGNLTSQQRNLIKSAKINQLRKSHHSQLQQHSSEQPHAWFKHASLSVVPTFSKQWIPNGLDVPSLWRWQPGFALIDKQ